MDGRLRRMLETSARLLRLLSLLQARRDWPGTELAGRLGVSPRTLRRDIDKVRSLGYPVDAVPGTAGGYRLGAGAALPPLLLDDEEAVAVAVGLRTAAGDEYSFDALVYAIGFDAMTGALNRIDIRGKGGEARALVALAGDDHVVALVAEDLDGHRDGVGHADDVAARAAVDDDTPVFIGSR